MDPRNVVLTGLPRSGTTLTCELLQGVTDTVALDEPMDKRPWVPPSRNPFKRKLPKGRGRSERLVPERFVPQIEAFFDETRSKLLSGQPVHSKNVEGRVFGGKFVDERSESGLRQQVTSRSLITITKPLTEDFVLVVKHNAGFTVALEHLAAVFRTFAVVRNPLSTLSSWQTVSIPINRGRVGRAERADPELRDLLDATEDTVDRQFILLDWFFGIYAKHLPVEQVLRYEDIVASGGRSLSAVTPNAEELDQPLQSRNKAKIYDQAMMRDLADRLLETDGPWWTYYSRESVRELAGA